MRCLALLAVLCGVCACGSPQGTAPPKDGWANNAPTLVERVVDRGTMQLLEVSQGTIRTWVQVPSVGATVGDYVLLGQGRLRQEVVLPELGETVREVVEIQHVRVVDGETARRAVRAHSPKDAVDIGVVFAELEQRRDRDIVVSGTVVKAPSAIGWYWVHLRDGTGDASTNTHDLTVKTKQPVTVGQRVAFGGTLRQDVDLGFGYHYEALIEDGVLVE